MLQCVCGMRYDADLPAEAARHREQHTEWESGIRVPELPENRVLAHWGGTDVLLVTNQSSVMQRELAARVAERARLDTPFAIPAYTIADTDPEVRIFLARAGDRAVGLAVLRPRPRWGWWSWDDYDAERRPATPVAPLPSWTVELIWALPRVHQQGLARRLLDVAADTVEQPVSSFGWRRPFTPSGEAFVRRACSEGFWVPD